MGENNWRLNTQKGLILGYYSIFIGLTYYLTAVYNSNLLLKLDELSIFLSTQLFLIDHLREPAGLLSYLGAFLNQFFYYPRLGSALFILALITVQYVSYKAFKIPPKYYLLSFIPPAALLLLVTQLDYVIYEFIANGFAYSNVIGVLLTCFSLWMFHRIKPQWLKYVFSLLYILVFFPLAGFYALLAALLFIISEIGTFLNNNKKRESLIVLSLLVLTLILVPIWYYQKIFQVSLKGIYTAGLPEFKLSKIEFLYWLPILILTLSFLFFSVRSFFNKTVLKSNSSTYISFTAGLVMLFVVYRFSNKDENFHSELAIDQAIFNNNWPEVLKLERKIKGEPSKFIVLGTRLALQKMHKAGDLMFTRKQGGKKQNSIRELLLWSYAAQPLFYNYGMLSDCYRWSMEDMARYGPKVQYLRYMVKCCILNDELILAEKYNSLLMKTLFHKKWAKEYQKYIDHPERIESNSEFKSNLLLYTFSDGLVTDYGNLDNYILTRLASVSGGDLKLLELSMQSLLLLKDKDRFWPFFFLYLKKHDKIPIHYQEAAIFFSQKNKNIDISKIPLDEGIVKKFYQAHKNIPEHNAQEHFGKLYGDTYWYYLYYGKP